MSYSPSDKQLQAIENMEKFCGIRSHRTQFSDGKEFDEYFKKLQARGKKKAKTREDVASGKISYSEINARKQQKKQEHYNNYEVLRSYAIDYINRYFPSIKQTEDKLLEKSKNYDLSREVIE